MKESKNTPKTYLPRNAFSDSTTKLKIFKTLPKNVFIGEHAF